MSRSPVRLEDFISRATKVHGDRYLYEKVLFSKVTDKVSIGCTHHGFFEQQARHHLSGSGCPKCSNNLRLTVSEILERARKEHGEKYCYSLTQPSNLHEKMEIICPRHGAFRQTINAHLRGQGCPKCFGSKGEIKIEAYLKTAGIPYRTQEPIPSSFTPRRLRFDFCILGPRGNTVCYLEFDGRFHYEPVVLGKKDTLLLAKKRFLDQTQRDEIKFRYCEQAGIPLFRVKSVTSIGWLINSIVQRSAG